MSYNRDGLRHPTHIFEAALWGYAVKVRCSRCRHVAVFDAPGLWGLCRKKGWEDSRWEVAKRLRCTQCLQQGRKQAPRRIDFVQDAEPTIILPMPSGIDVQRELKKLRY